MLLAVLAAAALSTVPSSVPATRARPETDLPSLVRPADYPQAAIDARQQGRVRFTLAIDIRGRVDGCTIVESAGSAILDRASCIIVTRRARFRPALDPSNNPVRDAYAGELNWTLP